MLPPRLQAYGFHPLSSEIAHAHPPDPSLHGFVPIGMIYDWPTNRSITFAFQSHMLMDMIFFHSPFPVPVTWPMQLCPPATLWATAERYDLACFEAMRQAITDKRTEMMDIIRIATGYPSPPKGYPESALQDIYAAVDIVMGIAFTGIAITSHGKIVDTSEFAPNITVASA